MATLKDKSFVQLNVNNNCEKVNVSSVKTLTILIQLRPASHVMHMCDNKEITWGQLERTCGCGHCELVGGGGVGGLQKSREI